MASSITRRSPGCNMKNGDEFIHSGRRYIHIVTPDHVRNMLISKQKPLEKLISYCEDKYQIAVKMSIVTTERDKDEIERNMRAEKERLTEESNLRKEELVKCAPVKVKVLNELEQDYKDKQDYILGKAHELRLEQQEEIKVCNSIILSSQCQAIRDAQIAEKKKMQADHDKRKRQIEELEYKQYQIETEKLQNVKELKKNRNKDFLAIIENQIREKKIRNEMNALQVEEEGRQAKELAIQTLHDDLKATEEKARDKAKMREEAQKVNEQLKYIAGIEREEIRLEGLKNQEYVNRKRAEDARREAELAAVEMKKLKEGEHLGEIKRKARELQELKDLITAQRIKAEVDRKWREKEKAAALKRNEEKEALIVDCQKQILNRRKCQALQIEQQRRELESLARVSKETIENIQREERKRLENDDALRITLLKQIDYNDRQHKKNRKDDREEGLAERIGRMNREEKLNDCMKMKMQRARALKLPENYVLVMERKLKLNK